MNRIAIVEDDQGYRDTLFTYIKQYEQERDTAFEATPFEKADDFLAVYNGDYDIILMDIEMPGMSGLDAARAVLAQRPALCVLAVGLGLLVDGVRRQRRAGRFRGYLAMIGEKKSVAISALASATGRPKNKVCADLEDMLDAGLFPSGYLNYGGDRLVLGGGG